MHDHAIEYWFPDLKVNLKQFRFDNESSEDKTNFLK